MNGELLLKGYKFPEKLLLNLLDKTIITGEDTFTVFEIFNMLENYFSRKAFSDHYLDQGTVLVLNGNKLSGDEFAVFRLRPVVNLAEELKITKKSILGQVVQALFPQTNNTLPLIEEALQKSVLNPLNAITENYRVSYVYQGDDVFNIAKILLPVVKELSGQDILAKEHDQFYCKAMMLDFIERLEIDQRKLLLVELPEYGLKEGEVVEFITSLAKATIDNIIIYTNRIEVSKTIPQVYNYNVIKNGKLSGFDEYDQLEIILQNLAVDKSEAEIQQKVLESILQGQQRKDEFAWAVEEFLN